MELMTVRELFKNTEKYAGQEIEIGGWVRNKRPSKQFGFIVLNDGTYFTPVQVVYNDTLANFQEISKINVGAALIVKGTVEMTPDAKQPFEIKGKEITIEGECPSDYVLQKKRHSMEYLRTIQHLRPRTNTFQAVFRVRSVVAQAIHRFFDERGFVYVHTPLFTGNDCEGAGEMFQVTTLSMEKIAELGVKAGIGGMKIEDAHKIVDYSKDFFGKKASLTVSGQLEAETLATALSRVYTFGPTFRAENSNTPRHLAEFWMIEPEMAFFDLNDDMDIQEDFVKYLLNWALTKCRSDLEFFDKRIQPGLIESLEKVANAKFVRISYTEAIAELEKHSDKFEFKPYWGCDIATEHEKFLTEQIYKCPVMVFNYPKEIKSFYMKQNEDGKTVKAVDVLVPGIGELIGGSEREENYEKLLAACKERNMDMSNYQWYLDLRRFGTVPHSGFGLGFERLIRYVTGMENIRDVIPYPRAPKSADF